MTTSTAMTYFWRGQLIPDIRAWATERGERIVRYEARRERPNMLTGRLEVEVVEGEMPESFWNSLMISDGWVYRDLARD